MINIAVCDDNTVVLNNLYLYLSDSFSTRTDEYCIERFTNGRILLDSHSLCPFDAIFLDIDMPDFSGFDVAKFLRENFSNTYIVFVTSHSELVYNSMDFQPFNFIRKDCNIPLKQSIDCIVEKLMYHMKQNDKIVLEAEERSKYVIYIRNILYIESCKHYIMYHIFGIDKPVKCRGSMKECEEKFAKYNFVRIHKGFILNLEHVLFLDAIKGEVVVDYENKSIPVSKLYKNEVDEKYTEYLRTTV